MWVLLVFRASCVLCGAGPLCVLVGGGPPASRPHRELCSVRRLEARPGPAVAHRHLSQFEVGSPVVMSCASSQLRASGENVYAGGRSSA